MGTVTFDQSVLGEARALTKRLLALGGEEVMAGAKCLESTLRAWLDLFLMLLSWPRAPSKSTQVHGRSSIKRKGSYLPLSIHNTLRVKGWRLRMGTQLPPGLEFCLDAEMPSLYLYPSLSSKKYQMIFNI
jgi:hypothetical protein